MTQQPFTPNLPGYPAQPQAQAPGVAAQGAIAPMAAPQAAPAYPPQQQNFAPQPQQWDPNLGNAIANATVGIQRLPQIPAGDHLLELIKTEAPERTRALVAEFRVVESTTCQPGECYSWYQGLEGGSPEKAEAQYGAVLTMVLRVAGFETKEAAIAGGLDATQMAALINACTTAPGPLAGRRVRVNGVDTGKVGAKLGRPIINHSFSVYSG